MKNDTYKKISKKISVGLLGALLLVFAGVFSLRTHSAIASSVDTDPAHNSTNAMDMDPAHHRNNPSFVVPDPAHNSTDATDMDPAHHLGDLKFLDPDPAHNSTDATDMDPAHHQSGNQKDTKVFTSILSPLNNSGVHGFSRLTLKGDQLNVKIFATGLEAGKEHPQHIHGMVDKSNSVCPAQNADTDGDGTVSLLEGLPFYGPVLQSLTPFQSVMIETYDQTFTVNPNNPEADVMPLANREIVLHGMTVAANQDKSNPAAGYDATLPVACGHINAVN